MSTGTDEPEHSTGTASSSHHEEVDALLTLAKIPRDGSLSSSAFDYSSITKLDLFQCNLSALPEELPTLLPNLSILFCMKNEFTEFPSIIGQCPKLQMVSFKSNKNLTSIHPDALQSQMRWLILTDTKLQSIPSTIGRCTKLQKLMLSGNQLKELPKEIGLCKNLELVRLASNQLEEAPMDLLKLPKLAWVAVSANPFLKKHLEDKSNDDNDDTNKSDKKSLKVFDDEQLEDPELGEILGSGASGITRKYVIDNQQPVAVKEYCTSTITSDGDPEEERKISLVASSLKCNSLIQVLGRTKTKKSLVMELLTDYRVLAGPPSMESCSRDVYPSDAKDYINGESDDGAAAEGIVSNLLYALMKLHENGICHGDFYGHNILLSTKSSSKVWLTDFGAAFFYDRHSEYGKLIELAERRAFSHLVNEIADLLCLKKGSPVESLKPVISKLRTLAGLCAELTFHDLYAKWKSY